MALNDGEIVGFVAWGIQPWNARLVIWHFYVDSEHRRYGIGRALMDQALDRGRRSGARVAWLETSNLNHQGVQVYRRLGFEICGVDLTLYLATGSERETAIFLARGLDAQ